MVLFENDVSIGNSACNLLIVIKRQSIFSQLNGTAVIKEGQNKPESATLKLGEL